MNKLKVTTLICLYTLPYIYHDHVHQKLTEKLVLSDRTWCHHLGGIYNISPCFKWHSHVTEFL